MNNSEKLGVLGVLTALDMGLVATGHRTAGAAGAVGTMLYWIWAVATGEK